MPKGQCEQVGVGDLPVAGDAPEWGGLRISRRDFVRPKDVAWQSPNSPE